MKWEKKGLIFYPNNETWWMKSRAYLPTVDVLEDRIRVYFSTMDDNMVGRIGYVDLDRKDPKNILDISKEPILDIGSPGMFDEHGVTPSCVINVRGFKYLYYFGWMKTTEAPQILFTGLSWSPGRCSDS